MHEIALHCIPLWIEHQRHALAPHIFVSRARTDEFPPSWPAEHIFPERKRVLEIVLLHNPGRSQAAPRKTVLHVILLEHHLLEDFRKRVAAWIGTMLLLFGHRQFVRIIKMSQRRIPADHNNLPEGFAEPALLQQ